MKTLLLTDERPRKSLDRRDVNVPIGHMLPEGNEVQIPFTVAVEAGMRWHPDWPAPMVTVNAWLPLPQGDVLGWSGTSASDLLTTLLPPEVIALASYHGREVATLDDKGKAALKALGLAEPKAKEPLAAFILPSQTRH